MTVKPSHVAKGEMQYCSRLCRPGGYGLPALERFERFLNKDGPVIHPELGPCWLWTGALYKSTGYGAFGYQGRTEPAHRAAWLLAHPDEPLTRTDIIAHHCDIRACARLAHLFKTTHAGNRADMYAKQRHEHGIRHHNAKLTEEDVQTIRARYAQGVTQPDLAHDYGVTQTLVSRVIRRQIWRHVPDPAPLLAHGPLKRHGEAHHNSKLTEAIVRDIRERYAAGGVSQQALADEYGLTQVNVSTIVRQKSWTHA
jgi:uncharacterized protein (DUF433 family)